MKKNIPLFLRVATQFKLSGGEARRLIRNGRILLRGNKTLNENTITNEEDVIHLLGVSEHSKKN